MICALCKNDGDFQEYHSDVYLFYLPELINTLLDINVVFVMLFLDHSI